MKAPVIVSQSPNKLNIFYKVNTEICEVEDAFTERVEDFRTKSVAMQGTIIFCRSYDSCTHVYYFIRIASLADT